MQAIRSAKEQQSLYLESILVAAMRGIAEEYETSVSDVANELLRVAIEQHRSESVMRQKIQRLEQVLPPDLVDPPTDHPLLAGKQPIDVIIQRRWSPLTYAPD